MNAYDKILVNEARGNISSALGESDITQSWLAKALSKRREWVNLMLKGKRNLYLDQLVTICRLTGKSLAWFFQANDKTIRRAKLCEDILRELETQRKNFLILAPTLTMF